MPNDEELERLIQTPEIQQNRRHVRYNDRIVKEA
jgi:hypothetical protein